MRYLDFGIHFLSLNFAVFCLILTPIGIVCCGLDGKIIEGLWGVVAFAMSGWLAQRLWTQCEKKFDRLP